MRLQSARVRGWKNFVDSGWVDVEPSVSCLVGKNESGKSAFLQALYRLKPAYSNNSATSLELDYPRWRLIQDGRQQRLEDFSFVTCRFVLDTGELEELSGLVDASLPHDTVVEASRCYNGSLEYRLELSLPVVVQFVLDRAPQLSDAFNALAVTSLQALIELTKEAGGRAIQQVLKNLLRVTEDALPDSATDWLGKHLPTFFYFSNYDMLSGRTDLQRLQAGQNLQENELTALSLLSMAQVKASDLVQGDFERRKAQLEAASSDISRQVFRYWTQNRYLRTSFDVEAEAVQQQNGQTLVYRYLNIRLADQRHGDFTTNIDTRSTGFRWFFSFIAAFSDFAHRRDVIVLLDEPGLSLHGRAQGDFLRYVQNELAPYAQVIYSTHSPFLVDVRHLESVRVVEDNSTPENPDDAARIRQDAFSRDPDTLFPLQGALGYDLAQNLFIGSAEHLVVEGVADFMYLETLSEHLKTIGREGLDEKISIVPVGGLSKVPTFIALLGAHVSVSVLVDSSTQGMQRITDLIEEGMLPQSRLVTIGQALSSKEGDIEDLFEPAEYVTLFNHAFGSRALDVAILDGRGRILAQISRTFGEFDHRLPASALIKHKAEILDSLSENTILRFEMLFRLVNRTIPRA